MPSSTGSMRATMLLQDGEVDEFMLRPIEEVAHLVSESTDFKPNCALVIIDFLVPPPSYNPNINAHS